MPRVYKCGFVCSRLEGGIDESCGAWCVCALVMMVSARNDAFKVGVG